MNLPTLLNELEQLEKDATPGPWCLTFEQEEGFPCLFTDNNKTNDVSVYDLNLMDMSRNSLPVLIQALRELSFMCGQFVEYFDAIEAGEYPRSRQELRNFERVLRNKAKATLKEYNFTEDSRGSDD